MAIRNFKKRVERIKQQQQFMATRRMQLKDNDRASRIHRILVTQPETKRARRITELLSLAKQRKIQLSTGETT